MKTIWVPKSETTVTIKDGKINVWDTMVMTEKPIAAAPTGFNR